MANPIVNKSTKRKTNKKQYLDIKIAHLSMTRIKYHKNFMTT